MAKQRRLDRLADDMNPVFIVGAPRSGSSLLYRTLQHHPSFTCPHADGGVNLQETDIVALLKQLPSFDAQHPRKLVQFLLRDERAIAAFLDSIEPLQKQAGTESRLARWADRLRRRLGRHRPAEVTVVRNFFAIAKQARGPKRLVEKTPHHVEHLRLFRTAFPRSRFLYVHRHPVEVYGSYRRRAQVDPRALWAQLSVDEFVELYGRMSRRALAEAASSDDLLLVSYERFVRQPQEAFADICSFLGEPFDERSLEPREDRDYRIDPHLFGEITTRTKDWRDYVEPREAAAIEARLTDVMQQWGYEPVSIASAPSA